MPQSLDRAARHAGQARSRVDIVQVDHGVVARDIDPLGNHRWPGRRLQRNRLEEIPLRVNRQRKHVVEDVDQINPPGATSRRAARRPGSTFR